MTKTEIEIGQGKRFAFGANWSRFLSTLKEERIACAEESLQQMLGFARLDGLRFLDIGSGSGLFSLAARRLGACVHSFDYDPKSVACTAELRRRYFPDDTNWVVEEGSVLDVDYLNTLGKFDVVYSWGVLHHTGAMWEALDIVDRLVVPGGKLFVAIYNDQGWPSKMWLRVKNIYNRLPKFMQWVVLLPAFLRLWGPRTFRDIVAGRPFDTWRNYSIRSLRGMSAWHDVIDWVGGLPFEVAKPEQIFEFYRKRGYQLDRMRTCAGGKGCNELVFIRASMLKK